MTESQFRDLLDRYLHGKASAEEIRILDEFFESYQRQYPGDDVQQINPEVQSEILWKIHQRIGVEKKQSPARLTLWLKVAASVCIFVAAWFMIDRQLRTGEEDHKLSSAMLREQTTRGQKSEVVLPDGTKAYLNANSSIEYPEKFASASREVTLHGEAYFEVKHDVSSPFIVSTGQTRTKVLGTSFNIKSHRSKNIEVTLVDGSVSVTARDGLVLKPGEQAVIDHTSQAISMKKVDVSKYVGWKDNILYFERVSVSEAVSVLEDWYDIKIEVRSPSLQGCMITAKYQNESLENVLKSFQFLLRAKINRDDLKHIVITGNGCK